MTTVVEALQEATAELHNAASIYLGRADAVAAALANFTASATSIVNNYVNRAPTVGLWVDANNGQDTVASGSETSPFKTLDFALDNSDLSVNRDIFLLSDQVMTRTHPFFAKLSLVGYSRTPSGSGFSYAFARRKLSFLSEAANSPRAGIGRHIPFFDGGAGAMNFSYIDLVMPTPAPGVTFKYLINTSGQQYNFNGGSISVDQANADVCLFIGGQWQTVATFNNITFYPNLTGKIFNLAPAGTDLNGTFYFKSNITQP